MTLYSHVRYEEISRWPRLSATPHGPHPFPQRQGQTVLYVQHSLDSGTGLCAYYCTFIPCLLISYRASFEMVQTFSDSTRSATRAPRLLLHLVRYIGTRFVLERCYGVLI